MGYYSEGVLGITKEALNRCKLLDCNMPALLEQMEETVVADYIYFSFAQMKMYNGYDDVDAFYAWLDWLDDAYPDECAYGYTEMGEEGEIIDKGDSNEFDIWTTRTISSPVT